MAASDQPGRVEGASVLESLKTLVLRSTPPAKSNDEMLLERVESGAKDRQARLDAEARQREEVERQATIAQIRADDAAVRQLIAQHRSLAQEFEAVLGRLAQVVGQVSETQASIDWLRAQVWTAQRTLGADALDLPPYAYTAVDILPAVVGKLRR
jgi:small-conductance mechanosensitive channel